MDSYGAVVDEYIAFMKKIQCESERSCSAGRLYEVYEQIHGCV